MADDRDQLRTAPTEGKEAGAQDENRDFGDSAGYGSGGSTRDLHEVGDLDGDPIKGRRNPLDDVVKIKNPVQP